MASNYDHQEGACATIPSTSKPPPNVSTGIKNVWKWNLHKEFKIIRQVVQKYTWIAMDTEFPGTVIEPPRFCRTYGDFQYHRMRVNVDTLTLIQLGLTFMDKNGNTPSEYSTWQFNFKFCLRYDLHEVDSIKLLKNSGLNFELHELYGIDPLEFAELLTSSGLVLLDNITWLTFHSIYDFGYLLKILMDSRIPFYEEEFNMYLKTYFPNFYDVKYMMEFCRPLGGGLQDVANQLEIARTGMQHQAGSDALLTGMVFFKIKDKFFNGRVEGSGGVLYKLRRHQPVT